MPEVIPSPAVQWEYLAAEDRWLPLPDLTDETHALTLSGPVRFIGPQDPIPHRSKDLYWLRVRLTRSGHEIPPRIATIHLNTMTAIEGRSVPPKGGPVLTQIVGSGSGLPSQRINLDRINRIKQDKQDSSTSYPYPVHPVNPVKKGNSYTIQLG